MRKLVEFSSKGAGSTVVEVEVADGLEQTVRAGRVSDTIEKAEQTLEEALEKIKPAATAIISTLKELAVPPTESKVQFGFKLTAGAGAILASAGVEANYVVTLPGNRSAAFWPVHCHQSEL